MPNTTAYEFGDVLLMELDHTDQLQVQKRPAVVISTLAYNRSRPDIVVMPITGRSHPDAIRIIEWRAAGLLKESFVKPVIGTYEQGRIIRQLGRLDRNAQAAVKKAIAEILGFKQVASSSPSPARPS